MNPKTALRGLFACAAAAALAAPIALTGTSVVAQEGGLPPIVVPDNCVVVADGLANPRDIAVADDGTVYITEAGDGGDEAIFAEAGEGTPVPTEAISQRGSTGQVTVIAPDGTRSVLVSGLPSYIFGAEIVGPAGAVLVGDTLYIVVGGPGPATAAVDPVPNQDSVLAIDTATGEVTTVADIGGYERSSNPDGLGIDSNLYGITAGDGVLYVADAGGNAIYTVNPETGEFSVLAVTPGIPAPGAPNPFRGGAEEIDPVPTGVVANADGSVTVSLLSGFPFPPGGAGTITIAADGTVSEFTPGLTMVTGFAQGPDGALYATSFSDDLIGGEMPAPGTVVRINEDGSLTPVVSGLFLGNGLAFGPDGSIYVANVSSLPPGTPPMGQVLKCSAESESGANLTIELVDVAFLPKVSR